MTSTAANEYLRENATYIDDVSAAVLEALTNDQLATIMAASDEFCGADDSQPGIDNDLVRTDETIADYDEARLTAWRERGTREELELAAPAVFYEDAQAVKGQQRSSFVVVDLGEFRVVIKS